MWRWTTSPPVVPAAGRAVAVGLSTVALTGAARRQYSPFASSALGEAPGRVRGATDRRRRVEVAGATYRELLRASVEPGCNAWLHDVLVPVLVSLNWYE